MLDALAAQMLTDGLATVALAVGAIGLARRDLAAPLSRRIGAVLTGLAVFYAARAGFEASGAAVLDRISLMTACALPLGVLLLAEGVLRRHAPAALKLLFTLGGLALAVALAVAGQDAFVRRWVLGAYIVLSLASVTVLLLARDRTSLSRQENASVAALMAAGAAMTLLAITDFVPGIVGVSGIGAAALTFIISANPSSPREVRRVLGRLAGAVAVAGLAAWAFAGPLEVASLDAGSRLAAVLLALLLAAATVLGAGGPGTHATSRSFAEALAAADVSSLTSFLGALADQPRLAGLSLAEETLLAEYDTAGLAAAMADRRLWTRARLAEGRMAAHPRARDELDDLMARTEATHALMITPSPLRVALLTLPGVGSVEEAESDLGLFGKLAALAARTAP